ncbi:hypothetical protein [Sphingomicrobium sediminis]|uniref:Uncharacterized protein n=1 Tax=Sphingomicrobium sediminis TaxID=2950949 RepID=A0A9X2EHB9_9SPHN|nr:hypothetical protein [Sphingomicrobium sediminis]MCM8557542.1 hypothetical protein [Sphingomicrobium sediminis]
MNSHARLKPAPCRDEKRNMSTMFDDCDRRRLAGSLRLIYDNPNYGVPEDMQALLEELDKVAL